MIHHHRGARLLRWGWGRVLVDIKGFVHPRRSAPSGGTQAPPKPADWDRLKKVERNLVLSNQYSVLSDDEMTPRQSHQTEVMEHSFSTETWESSKPTSRSLLCFWDGIGRLYLDCRKRFLTNSKLPSFSGFNILTRNSLNDKATRGVALLINKSYLFSEFHLNTPLQVVVALQSYTKNMLLEKTSQGSMV